MQYKLIRKTNMRETNIPDFKFPQIVRYKLNIIYSYNNICFYNI